MVLESGLGYRNEMKLHAQLDDRFRMAMMFRIQR
jgi:hypothetical protein